MIPFDQLELSSSTGGYTNIYWRHLTGQRYFPRASLGAVGGVSFSLAHGKFLFVFVFCFLFFLGLGTCTGIALLPMLPSWPFALGRKGQSLAHRGQRSLSMNTYC